MFHTVEASTLYAPGTGLRSGENEAFQDRLSSLRPAKINTLPFELLSEIFNLIVYENEVDHKLSSAPIILAHVCSHWRSVAFGTASLWTTITLGPRSNIERAKFELNLSGLRPVDFHLKFRGCEQSCFGNCCPVDPVQAKKIEELISLMVDNDNYLRWRTVKIDSWEPLQMFLDRTSSIPTFPMLEKLKFDLIRGVAGYVGFGESAGRRLFGGCATTPNLRHVSLICLYMDWTTAPNVLKNLTVLHIGYMASKAAPTMDEFLSVMRASPNMEEFVLLACIPTIADDALPSNSPHMCLFFPYLRRFRFGWVDVEQAVQLLCIFQLPALEDLFLEVSTGHSHSHRDSSAVLETLIKFNLTPSVCDPASITGALYPLSRLRIFTMKWLDVRPDIFLSLLADIGNIEVIRILANADIALVDPFAVYPASLCTKLRKLTFKFPQDGTQSMVLFLPRIELARPAVLASIVMGQRVSTRNF